VTIPGNTGCPTRPERGGITTSARPEERLNNVSAAPAGASSDRKGQHLVGCQSADGRCVAPDDEKCHPRLALPSAVVRRHPARMVTSVRLAYSVRPATAGGEPTYGERDRTRN